MLSKKHKIPPNIIWNKINSIRGNKFKILPDILHYNQERITSSQNASEDFANYFHKNNSDKNYNPDFITLRNSSPDIPILLMDQNNEHFKKNLLISQNYLLHFKTAKAKAPALTIFRTHL
jgi:hypothetical protein